jgi:hypothetical protein
MTLGLSVRYHLSEKPCECHQHRLSHLQGVLDNVQSGLIACLMSNILVFMNIGELVLIVGHTRECLDGNDEVGGVLTSYARYKYPARLVPTPPPFNYTSLTYRGRRAQTPSAYWSRLSADS